MLYSKCMEIPYAKVIPSSRKIEWQMSFSQTFFQTYDRNKLL